MTNPFDDESGTFLVLPNEEEQYSLWPSHIDVPAGWRVVHPADGRRACLDFIESNWTDMRPNSLRLAMEKAEATASGQPTDKINPSGEDK
ncbi:MbtH family protein [Taklimakanibacter albus]|uniref:MbtH family protein n=1 Tax=Taklimakanibacter albus TaxID=2800327 RepID=A0ACC5R3T1_9HYPH|nr:MbtH family protein [Aestuariivirga sp. YIM B02566]MBK1867309.1 MbtH family protein [Aestuariivirga sp. YIM B02566]